MAGQLREKILSTEARCRHTPWCQDWSCLWIRTESRIPPRRAALGVCAAMNAAGAEPGSKLELGLTRWASITKAIRGYLDGPGLQPPSSPTRPNIG
nr:unnamed protein product [Digitaria exilis]